ncbi:hypothetical protein Leryth_001907 [Lithospermum erythrorhizon]|nr:hypothetical protein Leryth_001907 [Lithospermum erythrorhizon]
MEQEMPILCCQRRRTMLNGWSWSEPRKQSQWDSISKTNKQLPVENGRQFCMVEFQLRDIYIEIPEDPLAHNQAL